MRLNRGILFVGLAGTLAALGNVYISVIFYALLCFDSCFDVGSTIASGQLQGLLGLLAPLAMLIPSLALILAGWIWALVELRRSNAGRTRALVAYFPAMSLIVGVAVTLIASVTAQRGLVVFPIDIWYGTFALALWPLAVTLVSIFWRGQGQPHAAGTGTASG